MDKAEKLFNKISGYTEYGRKEQAARARALASEAKDLEAANKEHRIMALLKGRVVEPYFKILKARKQAYKSQLKGISNVKGHIPFVGMGEAGEKALEKVTTNK